MRWSASDPQRTRRCASPPLTIYTLGTPAAMDAMPMNRRSAVIEVRRVTVPDYLDSKGLLVRNGNVLARSTQGGWATRLSLEATYYLTSVLGREPAILPRNPAQPIRRGRAPLTSSGPVVTDQDVVSLTQDPLSRLANAIRPLSRSADQVPTAARRRSRSVAAIGSRRTTKM